MSRNVANYFGMNYPRTNAFEAELQDAKALPMQRKGLDFVGVEIEIEGLATTANVLRHMIQISAGNDVTKACMSRMFEVKADGSLRNYGVEFITIPVHITSLPDLLHFLYGEVIQPNYPRAEFSDRCGIHIHYDVTRMDIKQILIFTMIYSIYEKELFRLAGVDRADSNFCVPLRNQCPWEWFPQNFESWILFNDLIPTPDRGKYSAMNFTRIRDLGTVEFRHLPGTFDIDLIIRFAMCCQRMKEYAVNKKLEEMLFKNLEVANTISCYRQITDDIFKDYSYVIWPDGASYFDIEAGVTFAKKLKFLVENYDEVSKPTTTLEALRNPTFGPKLEQFITKKTGGTPAKKPLHELDEDEEFNARPVRRQRPELRRNNLYFNDPQVLRWDAIFQANPLQGAAAAAPPEPEVPQPREPHPYNELAAEYQPRVPDGPGLGTINEIGGRRVIWAQRTHPDGHQFREWMWLEDYERQNGQFGVIR